MFKSFFNQTKFREQTFKNIDNKNLEKAKTYPIQKMYNGELRRTGKTLMGLCPFHQEDTPSFAIYPETNTWCCFAKCGGGDAISFCMKLYNLSFQEALTKLNQ